MCVVSVVRKPPALIVSPNKANTAVRRAILMSETTPRLASQSEELATEIEWLNAYHARVRRELGDGLSEVEQDWLDTATRAI